MDGRETERGDLAMNDILESRKYLPLEAVMRASRFLGECSAQVRYLALRSGIVKVYCVLLPAPSKLYKPAHGGYPGVVECNASIEEAAVQDFLRRERQRREWDFFVRQELELPPRGGYPGARHS